MSKAEAERLSDALRELHDSKKPHQTGPHGQMMGQESYRIVASGNSLYVLMEAYDLLRRWPDGEVAAYQYLFDGPYGEVWRNDSGPWNGMPPKAIRPLYTAPPAESERIAALEAVIEQARVALHLAVRQNEHDMLMTGEELRQCEDALRAVEETRSKT